MIDSFVDGWACFAKPGSTNFNRWWNGGCQSTKLAYEESPSHSTHHDFLQQCNLAKKEFFAKKIEEMVKQHKPWEGTNWIKQRVLPKVPQIVDNGKVLNDLTQMFNKMHTHFQLSSLLSHIFSFQIKMLKTLLNFSNRTQWLYPSRISLWT